jgi:hypothetical protein
MGNIDELVPRDVIEAELWPAYVLDAAGRIIDVNSAWDREARRAGGPLASAVIGTMWLDHIAGEDVRVWHRELLDRLRAPDRRGRGIAHICACNTPERFRLFTTRFQPLVRAGEGELAGVLVLTRLIEEAPVGERYIVEPFDERWLLEPDGVMVQCGGCRRVRVANSSPSVWVFVPELVARPRGNVSHGLCELCREVYYGIVPAGGGGRG